MPIIRSDRPIKALSSIGLMQRINAGRVVPIISDAAIFDLVLGSHERFAQRYSKYVRYPLPDKDNLVEMTNYHKLTARLKDEEVKVDYLNYVKNHIFFKASDEDADPALLEEAEEQVDGLTVSAFARILGYPRLDRGREDALLVLANRPFKTILTTSPYTFIEAALQRAGKNPRTETCRWRKELDGLDSVIDDAYKPSVAEPLVFHLHGLDRYPDSLVLTEDDYLEFLVNVCQDQGNNAVDRVHALVRRALSEDLLVLGFRLKSWAFRVLYAGLIKPNGKAEDRGVCCLQLVPTQEETSYLQSYLERAAKFDVFWGDINEYVKQLSE